MAVLVRWAVAWFPFEALHRLGSLLGARLASAPPKLWAQINHGAPLRSQPLLHQGLRKLACVQYLADRYRFYRLKTTFMVLKK